MLELLILPDHQLTDAPRALENEIVNMTARQLPSPITGLPQPPTLTSCLRRAFAARCGGHIVENVSRMWEILSSETFDKIDDDIMMRIVGGEEVAIGRRRMGY